MANANHAPNIRVYDNFKEEGGQYVTAEGYPFDGAKIAEQERLQTQAETMAAVMHNRIVHAPLKSPKRILEIGCGTGAATVHFAQQFPEAEVIGIDPNPVPPFNKKPENLKYLVGRFEDLLGQEHPDLHKGSFDYIYGRWLICAIKDWSLFIKQCASLLAPGAWLEMHESTLFQFYSAEQPNERIDEDWRWNKVVIDSCHKQGFDMEVGANLVKYMSDGAGLNNVREVYYPLATSPWPERSETEAFTTYFLDVGATIVRGMVKALTMGYIDESELGPLQDESARTQCDPSIKGVHWRFYAVCGQKPR